MQPPSRLGSWLWPQFVWRIPVTDRRVFLTFDDGPTPGLTGFVLSELAAAGAQATFFCLGRQAAAHPTWVQQLVATGHTVGHHTYHHLDGWRTPWATYAADCAAGKAAVELAAGQACPLFRPPYGHFPLPRVRALQAKHTVVLWDVLAGDYSPRFDLSTRLPRILRQVTPGSILVLHDSTKAEANLRVLLPPLLAELSTRGFVLQGLNAVLPC